MKKPRLADGVLLGIAIGTAIGVGTYTFVSAVTTAQDFQRRAQFYLDFTESERSK